jgi:proline dehydrogenase
VQQVLEFGKRMVVETVAAQARRSKNLFVMTRKNLVLYGQRENE